MHGDRPSLSLFKLKSPIPFWFDSISVKSCHFFRLENLWADKFVHKYKGDCSSMFFIFFRLVCLGIVIPPYFYTFVNFSNARVISINPYNFIDYESGF